MIGVDFNDTALQYFTVFFQTHNDCKQFLFSGSIVALSISELLAPVCNRASILDYCHSELIVGCISIYFKWFGIVGIFVDTLVCYQRFHCLESSFLGIVPSERFVAGTIA